VVGTFHLFDLSLRVVVDDDLEGLEDGHGTWHRLVQVFADTVFQKGYVDEIILLGDTDPGTELPYRPRRVSPSPHPGDGGHAGVVPPADQPAFHELDESSLAEDRVGEIQAGELYLSGFGTLYELLHEPVVQGPVVLELQGAYGMGDLLDGIGKAVGEVVHGIDDPLVTDAIMTGALDPVDDGVAHGDVGRCHVDLRSQHTTAIFELTGPHPGEDVKVLLDGPVAVRAVPARLRERAAVSPYLVGVEVADICLPLPDEGHSELVESLEVVGGEEEPALPVETEPADVILDGFDEFQ